MALGLGPNSCPNRRRNLPAKAPCPARNTTPVRSSTVSPIPGASGAGARAISIPMRTKRFSTKSFSICSPTSWPRRTVHSGSIRACMPSTASRVPRRVITMSTPLPTKWSSPSRPMPGPSPTPASSSTSRTTSSMRVESWISSRGRRGSSSTARARDPTFPRSGRPTKTCRGEAFPPASSPSSRSPTARRRPLNRAERRVAPPRWSSSTPTTPTLNPMSNGRRKRNTRWPASRPEARCFAATPTP